MRTICVWGLLVNEVGKNLANLPNDTVEMGNLEQEVKNVVKNWKN
jgi:hypothetical protein